MKKLHFYMLVIFALLLGSCKAQHSYNSVEGKKKLKYYNSIQYGNQPKKK